MFRVPDFGFFGCVGFFVCLSLSLDLLPCLHNIGINILLGKEFMRVVKSKAAACLELL